MDAFAIGAPTQSNTRVPDKTVDFVTKNDDELQKKRKTFARQFMTYQHNESTHHVMEHVLSQVASQQLIATEEDIDEKAVSVLLAHTIALAETPYDSGREMGQHKHVTPDKALLGVMKHRLPTSLEIEVQTEERSALPFVPMAGEEASHPWVLGRSVRVVRGGTTMSTELLTASERFVSKQTINPYNESALSRIDAQSVITPRLRQQAPVTNQRHVTDLFTLDEGEVHDALHNALIVGDEVDMANDESFEELDHIVGRSHMSHVTDVTESASSVKYTEMHDDIRNKGVWQHEPGTKKYDGDTLHVQTESKLTGKPIDEQQLHNEQTQPATRKQSNTPRQSEHRMSTEAVGESKTKQSVQRRLNVSDGTQSIGTKWNKFTPATAPSADQHMDGHSSREGQTDAHTYMHAHESSGPSRGSPQGTVQLNGAPSFADHLAADNIVEAEPRALGTLIHTIAVEQTEQTQTVRVALHPRHLGEIELQVALEQGALSAHIIAESEGTRRVIEAALPQLRDVMAEQGVALETITVSVFTHGETAFNNGSTDSFGDAHEQHGFASATSSLSSLAEHVEQTHTHSAHSMTYIDVLA